MNHTESTADLTITPFTVAVDQADLDDLRHRLGRTRYADQLPTDGWPQGTPVDHLRETVAAWRDFDWRAVEARLNALPQFRTEIDGQTIHFLHVRSPHAGATPLLLTHTYPGSVLDFLDMIEPLTAPETSGGSALDAFHLVIPSLPGMGFSTPLADGAWTMARTARAFDTLMRALGYDSYGAHGSDGGAMVSRELARQGVPGFLGAHVLQLFSFPSGDPSEFEKMTPADYAALEFAGWFQTVNGYADLNAKRPLTIAAALSDSPVGQLAYNELFWNFGNGTSLVTQEQVLAQASLMWLTNTSAGATRFHHTEKDAENGVNDGPIGVAVFADDFRSIRPFAERDNTDIVSWTEHPRGGHFASMEVPEELTNAIRTFYRDRRP
ncbi:epoxide hydrolase family protein [Actinomadura sp. 7K507]|uniref:epoxide hydrolase family protein n=1 Tax=Actinomadura sp. 7K507 TaxID=2530365 RepID=UPI001049BA33|nr:epoxide hydrolase family protein [Actinomadura sp. 7K507]TDC93950.1 epoxide hydrolase [Actinomadura sp. 7K507]